ncbi:hypothetical protein FACS1894167_11520 [Synergistales bacterium]|nr:hypothetical protein FACS1894167_11520 [Synergistales bacterium]GHV55391.1 hypothetical protein FACS1894216_17590 [Synergistales bacterium]
MKTIPLDEYVKQLVIEEAREDAKEEGKFEVARKMLARKMAVSDIIDLTGLDEDDILALS